MARKDSEHQKKSMSAMFRGKVIFKPLNTGGIKIECIRLAKKKECPSGGAR